MVERERITHATIRVRYLEVDRMQVAHHAAYLAWLEVGRTEWIRARGISYRQLEEEWGVLLPVLQVGLTYHAPARYDELLSIDTQLSELTGVRLRFRYRIVRAGQLLAEGSTWHATCRPGGTVRRLPAELKERLEAWVEPHESP